MRSCITIVFHRLNRITLKGFYTYLHKQHPFPGYPGLFPIVVTFNTEPIKNKKKTEIDALLKVFGTWRTSGGEDFVILTVTNVVRSASLT